MINEPLHIPNAPQMRNPIGPGAVRFKSSFVALPADQYGSAEGLDGRNGAGTAGRSPGDGTPRASAASAASAATLAPLIKVEEMQLSDRCLERGREREKEEKKNKILV